MDPGFWEAPYLEMIPKTRLDIADLQAAGVADADIVRLAELNAFLAYQIRVIAGLRLMQGHAP